MKKYYPIELDKGEFQLGAEKASPETNPTSNTFGLIPAGGGVTVKRLEVTENGTYTAPTGEAYSPVVVSVAGGGSSDFSTAEVTLTNPPSSGTVDFEQSVYLVIDGYMMGGNGSFSNADSTILFVLYKGEGYANFPQKQDFIVTGNIEYDQEIGDLLIRGDGTITINL